MIKTRDYKAADGLELLARPNEKPMGEMPFAEDFAKLAEMAGPGMTLLFDSKVVACCGVRLMWPGVGEAWAIFDTNIGKYHIDPQIGKKVIRSMMEKNNLFRLQCTPRTNWQPGISYVRYLGFEPEGVLRRFYPDGSDCVMCSIVKGDS